MRPCHRGGQQSRAKAAQGTRNGGDGWVPETRRDDLECSLRPGDLRWGPPLAGGASRRCSPRGLLAAPPPPRSQHRAGPSGAEQGAATPAPSRRARSRPPGGSTARGAGWAPGASPSPPCAREPQTPRAPGAAGPARPAREPVCSPGPGQLGRRGCQSPGSGPGPRDRPRRTRPQVRPPADRPGAGLGGGDRARPHLCPRFPPAARGARRRLPSPRPGRGAAERPVRGARRRRPCARRVRGAPAAIQLPGPAAGAVRGAGSQRAAAAAGWPGSRAAPARPR